MFSRKVRMVMMLFAVAFGLSIANMSNAQDCYRYQPLPSAGMGGYGSGYGMYPPNPGYGYGGPMMGQPMGGYGMPAYANYGAQPAYQPGYGSSPSIYVGASYASPQQGYRSEYGHHGHHHPWHLGHFLLGN